MDMDIVTDIVETHTFDYFLDVGSVERMGRKRELWINHDGVNFPLSKGICRCNITFFDEEDRKRIKAFMKRHGIHYSIMKCIRPMDD